MFGYILPEKPEMKIKEFELFRAYYCGVCKSIGKRYGQLKRLTLNYDSTFLALLLSAVSEKQEELLIHKERCIVHPQKKNAVIKNNAVIDYASDINILLAYLNMRDNWRDERSVVSAAGMIAMRRAYKKICGKYKEKCAIIEKRLEELVLLEKSGCASMDMAAEPFARLMEEVLAFRQLPDYERYEAALKWAGYNIGKWIYILDAYDDLEKDAGKRQYNPLLLQFGYRGEPMEEFRERIRSRVEFNLTHALGQISKAYELMELKSNAPIVENIIYLGMLRKTEQILKGRSCKEIEKSI
jgi:hypothetical protein